MPTKPPGSMKTLTTVRVGMLDYSEEKTELKS